MGRRMLTHSLILLLLSSQCTWAQWAVFDAPAAAQRTVLWIEEAAQWVQSLANQVKEIEATYNVIVQQVKQYETMVTNLQRIPEGLNFVETVILWGSQITGLLANANIISYDLERVMVQFNAMYQDLGTMNTANDVLAVRQRLLRGRMEASQMTVQVTAIKSNMTELYTRMCALLSGGWTAQGNLDVQQIQVQQNGLMQHTLESMAAMQAAHARNTAQYQAEQAAIERLQLQAIQGAMGTAAPLGDPRGALPRYHW